MIPLGRNFQNDLKGHEMGVDQKKKKMSKDVFSFKCELGRKTFFKKRPGKFQHLLSFRSKMEEEQELESHGRLSCL